MTILKEAGADINSRDMRGDAALDIAILNEDKETGAFLLAMDAKCFSEEIPADWQQWTVKWADILHMIKNRNDFIN